MNLARKLTLFKIGCSCKTAFTYAILFFPHPAILSLIYLLFVARGVFVVKGCVCVGNVALNVVHRQAVIQCCSSPKLKAF